MLDLEGTRQIRGGINIVFIGDTKVAKSETAKEITAKGIYPLGEYVVAETGSRTGLLYTIDTDTRALIWGELCLNDLGLVVIDGLQAFSSEEMGEFRESVEQQEVVVKRSVKGSAPARTRLLCLMNPGKKEEKAMCDYIYPCLAIKDSHVFSKSPDITRFDLFVPFSQADVPAAEIANRTEIERPIPKDIFMRHIFWVWSRKPEDIIIEDNAKNSIKRAAELFSEKYGNALLPVVHNGVRDLILRLSVAQAALEHSTDERQEKIIVRNEHVFNAVSFYQDMCVALALDAYVASVRGNNNLKEPEFITITKTLKPIEWKILEAIKINGKSSSILSTELSLSSRTIKEHYAILNRHGLIQTQTRTGICLTSRGVQFLKLTEGTGSISAIVQKSFTNELDSEPKLHHCTNQEHTPQQKTGEADPNA